MCHADMETAYFDINGQCHHADKEVLAVLSECLRLPENSETGYADIIVCTENETARLPETQQGRAWRITDEHGKPCGSIGADGVIPPLPAGYFDLENAGSRLLLICAPPQVWQPPSGRSNGITVQLYALRSAANWGIGDFADLRRLAVFCAGQGLDFIGINPLHAPFAARPDFASPYSPNSRHGFNPIYLDVSAVPAFQNADRETGWLKKHQPALQAARAAETVDYRAVWRLKEAALREAFAYFDDDKGQFAQFIEQNPYLHGFALFETLDAQFAAPDRALGWHGWHGWHGWPSEYHDPQGRAVHVFSQKNQNEIRFRMWLQWLCAEQLADVRRVAENGGLRLGIYGDLAVGAARGSADTWLNQNLYCTDAGIGAPPDPFSPVGQNWQLPPMRPQALRRSGLAAWRAVLRAAMAACGMLRIDHVMALSRLWWVAGNGDAARGAYVRYPAEAMFAALAVESVRARCAVVGEDLGTVSDEVRGLLRRYGIFSYNVLYFARDGQAFRQPENFAEQSLTVTSTHDLAPLAGWWQGADLREMHRFGTLPDLPVAEAARAADKRALLDALHRAGCLKSAQQDVDFQDLLTAVHRFGAGGRSRLYAVQMPNLLGCTENDNIPGVADGYPNWSRKLPLDLEQIFNCAAVRAQLSLLQERTMKPYPEPDQAERDTIDALFRAEYADPFAYLGRHRLPDGREVVRCLLPAASAVEIVAEGKRHAAERLDVRGFFAAVLPENCPAYRLAVHYGEQVLEQEDVYRFPSHLREMDAWLLGEGSHLRPYEALGAHFVALDGVRGVNFAVWAPNAQRVSVVGEFNGWDGRRHPMRCHRNTGIWEIFIPDVPFNALYKFEIRDAGGHILTKSDPYAFAAELRPTTASIVRGLPEKMPPLAADINGIARPVSIYEVHLGSWRRNPENGFWLTYEQLASELVHYVKDMGFTHIELLPLSEYPFDGSWGYQATGLYAPTSRFGSPQQLQALVQAAHDAGIGVLLDWVVGHFPADAHGLARFDGTPLYEHADPREGFHQDWNTLIYNFGRYEVKNFLQGNALYWLERFGFDGLRVDAVASMIYRDYSRKEGEWIPNRYGGRENIEAIEFLRDTNQMLGEHAPHAAQFAEESTSFANVTRLEGLNFAYKWNMGWMNDTLRYMREDPINRKYHHNLMTFGMMYQYSENFVLPLSHDEVVHGKGSLLDKMPGDCWQKFANLRAYYGFMFAHPGKKLLFMGNEFAQGREWDYDRALDWHLLDEAGGWHRGVQDFVRDLNGVYRRHAPLYQLDQYPEGFEWLVADDHEQSVFVFERRDRAGNRLIAVCNFTPVVRENYRFGIHAAGEYALLLNSDAEIYGGSGVSGSLQSVRSENVASHGKAQSLCLTVPPLASVYLYWAADGEAA